ncbi:phytochelatin synthase family protein [Trichocoleus sp. DQ-A1]
MILDVSCYKSSPVWVKAEDLWKAMATLDSESDKTRGFVQASSCQSCADSSSQMQIKSHPDRQRRQPNVIRFVPVKDKLHGIHL